MTTTLDRPLVSDPASADELRRRELAAFLRSRRERLAPDQLGLVHSGRRRTPGLRREEVAAHAGVGVTWYTWLEQARDINVSEQVLDAIARTLLLDPHERFHLFTLAGAPTVAATSDSAPISDQVRQIMAKLDPYPAAVTNGRMDLLAYNRAYAGLMGDLDALPFEQRNTLWLYFTKPEMRSVHTNWDLASRWMVARFRSAMADHVGDPAWKCMVKRLLEASPEFAELWQRHDVAPSENMTKHLLHPQLGLMNLAMTNTWLAERQGLRMIVYTPFDDETANALNQLSTLVPRSIPV